ncbi:MAG: acetyl-CoA carboxylase carboxyltransferase subunit [Geobacteraceae bacterium]|nr:acetyl-CoA carboxylase carboxyltransferase subunit [Geobacteraceae bacterium]
MAKKVLKPSLENPLDPPENVEFTIPGEVPGQKGPYEEAMKEGHDLMERPIKSVPVGQIEKQHFKQRMTVWERIKVLTENEPNIHFQNWGRNLDGASLVTGILNINGRDVAFYGHDFTVRAGSIDATNGSKLAKLFNMAGEKGIPVIGMNDSAGAFVPAGVGGLDGYAEAFTSLRKISGVVPSIMCMFGFNAGGGSYLPRQGSFVIQPEDTFFGLTGPGVVKSVLGEDISPEDLGGPKVHGNSGVADLTVEDETSALRTAVQLLGYLPDNNHSICDHGDYFEIQPSRAREAITAFGRLDGNVVGFVANNSAVSSGQIDCDSAVKIARFVRFCNIYNIPLIFMEDTTGFLPGREQEARGIVQAGRSMLDSIVDVRTPRILLILRNAYGGAYASYNNYPTGADLVLALPTTRLAVMGPAGKEFVYKDELRKLRAAVPGMIQQGIEKRVAAGLERAEAKREAEAEAAAWLQQEEVKLNTRYEKELMNPKEGLSLGSISSLAMPTDLRHVLGRNMNFFLRHYEPSAWQSVQREFH